MSPTIVPFAAFLLPAAVSAGVMTALQIQHYGIYPAVGRDVFATDMRANDRAALVPAILPALLLLFTSLVLVGYRPSFMSRTEAAIALLLNLAALASTFIWQRPIQGGMAASGYDEQKVRKLIATNSIRTAAFLVQALLATIIAASALPG